MSRAVTKKRAGKSNYQRTWNVTTAAHSSAVGYVIRVIAIWILLPYLLIYAIQVDTTDTYCNHKTWTILIIFVRE